ncbi:PREDICTED: sushi, nidogen and EGF-like domain-containing protein 1 [Amphimedon queenslandica]|uniref:NIDO domain-containing protein n=1 Tax=Amphimedon queenslandica TaxID=400682 RepID=A0AAN0JIY5_AMPQE|nr:PREDICTED: sushi, nidogen and EGF-like domain-containing protein 1 [Amphimedon queenslandica]|eukprot:XP_019856727.1 PREDICTED: sushi, nidogen and EGF-like domain-containing protein 1 [Amphimedon queenslandica]
MGSGLLTVIILVILSTCYTPNGLSLTDFYLYGTEHGDNMMTVDSLPAAPLLAPIDNLVILGPAGITATIYQARSNGYLQIQNNADSIFLFLLFASGNFGETKVFGRTTNDPALIKRAMGQINEAFPNTFCSTSPPTQLIIATWIDYLKYHSNPGSNFQTVIVTNGHLTFGIFLYVDVHITAADTGIASLINGNYVESDPSIFPFNTTVTNAPSMMLNSNIPGTYILSLTDPPPDPPNCLAMCKAKLPEKTCKAIRNMV